jgi:hypothetical protein
LIVTAWVLWGARVLNVELAAIAGIWVTAKGNDRPYRTPSIFVGDIFQGFPETFTPGHRNG